MNRRNFLAGLLAAPIAHEVEPVRRVYSFLWDDAPRVRRYTAEQQAAMIRQLYAETGEMMDQIGRSLGALYWGPPVCDSFVVLP